jgi:predicted ester cyclase
LKILTDNIAKYEDFAQVVNETATELLSTTVKIASNEPKMSITPFQIYARKFFLNFPGGKMDDISLIVACVRK